MFPAPEHGYAANSYADGEIVSLLTGGPEMTVIGGKDGYSLVAWFAGEHLQQALFPVDALYSLRTMVTIRRRRHHQAVCGIVLTTEA